MRGCAVGRGRLAEWDGPWRPHRAQLSRPLLCSPRVLCCPARARHLRIRPTQGPDCKLVACLQRLGPWLGT